MKRISTVLRYRLRAENKEDLAKLRDKVLTYQKYKKYFLLLPVIQINSDSVDFEPIPSCHPYKILPSEIPSRDKVARERGPKIDVIPQEIRRKIIDIGVNCSVVAKREGRRISLSTFADCCYSMFCNDIEFFYSLMDINDIYSAAIFNNHIVFIKY